MHREAGVMQAGVPSREGIIVCALLTVTQPWSTDITVATSTLLPTAACGVGGYYAASVYSWQSKVERLKDPTVVV